MRLLLVNCSKIATKNFPRLCIGVFKADKIGLKYGQSSTYFLCNLQESYIITGLVPLVSDVFVNWKRPSKGPLTVLNYKLFSKVKIIYVTIFASKTLFPKSINQVLFTSFSVDYTMYSITENAQGTLLQEVVNIFVVHI